MTERLPRFTIDLHELERDPYPVYDQIRAQGVLVWIEQLDMWYATRYEDVRAILLDAEKFTTACESSLIFDTFGSNMLTTEGAEHDRYRRPAQHAFQPSYIRQRLEAAITESTQTLIREFRGQGSGDLRTLFAARLPIQVMLHLLGIAASGESRVRAWYDSFESALSNFSRNQQIRSAAQSNVAAFHDFLDAAMNEMAKDSDSLLSSLVNARGQGGLDSQEIKRNLLIILFGGISTVEGLILNALWAIFTDGSMFARVKADSSAVPKIVEETMRWMGPVQSATRHVVHECEYKGTRLGKGETINCMLAAANRDASVFPEPNRFDPERKNLQRHLGFAMGVHGCLGLNLARAEARIALTSLLAELPDLRMVGSETLPPSGYEFRQSRRLTAAWGGS
jgi:cytochrome P450